MGIVLVRPTTFINMKEYPLNIGYIYASLKQENSFEVSFIDGEQIGLKYIKDRDIIVKTPRHILWKSIVNRIFESNPDIIAFSCYSISMTTTKYITDIIRSEGFKGQIWAGGIHPTTCPSETLENIEGLNGVVIGEGERTFIEVCRAIYNNASLSDIKGIAYKDNGTVKINENRQLIEDLDTLPMPFRDFPEYSYSNHIILSSRGCPFGCDFCDSKSIWGRRARFRSGEHVTREIEEIAQKGQKIIGIRDDTFTLRKKHVEDICRSLKNKNLDKRIKLNVGSRIDTMDNEMLVLLKRMNVDFVTFGVETGSSAMQKKIKKNLDISTVVPTIKKTSDAGIRSVTFFMVGHPGETENDINDTYLLIKELSKYCGKRNFISINIVCPYPGTGYWNYATSKYGNFIDFYKKSFNYSHQSKPFVNITNMENDVFNNQITRIIRLANSCNIKYKIYTAISNPTLTARKIKERFLS